MESGSGSAEAHTVVEVRLRRMQREPNLVSFRLRRLLHSHDRGQQSTVLKRWVPEERDDRPSNFTGLLEILEASPGVPLTLSIGEEVACLRLHAIIPPDEHQVWEELWAKHRHLPPLLPRIFALVRTKSGREGWLPETLLRDVGTAPCYDHSNTLQNPLLRAFIMGTADPVSPICRLRWNSNILGLIRDMTLRAWDNHLNWGEPAAYKVTDLEFPPPRGININMMPFIVGDRKSLPEELAGYWPMIEACERSGKTSNRQVGYLTISEGVVEAGKSQRRGGVHTDMTCVRRLREWSPAQEREPTELSYFTWGWGRVSDGQFLGGIYMASNLDDTCAVWDTKVEEMGLRGDVEHLRAHLGTGVHMKAGELWWMTDRTPHESLPLQSQAHRQYFRYVTSGISAWYEAHSTKNPLGVVPSANVRILRENKFAQDVHLLVGPTWEHVLQDPATLALMRQLELNAPLMKATHSMAIYHDPIVVNEDGFVMTAIKEDREVVENYFALEDPEQVRLLSAWVVRIQLEQDAYIYMKDHEDQYSSEHPSPIQRLTEGMDNALVISCLSNSNVLHVRVKLPGCSLETY